MFNSRKRTHAAEGEKISHKVKTTNNNDKSTQRRMRTYTYTYTHAHFEPNQNHRCHYEQAGAPLPDTCPRRRLC